MKKTNFHLYLKIKKQEKMISINIMTLINFKYTEVCMGAKTHVAKEMSITVCCFLSPINTHNKMVVEFVAQIAQNNGKHVTSNALPVGQQSFFSTPVAAKTDTGSIF